MTCSEEPNIHADDSIGQAVELRVACTLARPACLTCESRILDENGDSEAVNRLLHHRFEGREQYQRTQIAEDNHG
jgi:hypothetical protein